MQKARATANLQPDSSFACIACILSEGGEIGHFLLKHGVGFKPGGYEIDTPLNYGDYYFLEALLRARNL